MDLSDIKRILDLIQEHDLAEFELEQDGLKVRIRKSGPETAAAATPAAVAAAPAPVAAAVPAGPPVAPALPVEEPVGVELAVIKSPIVGTFYRAPEPGARPFVDVGDTVKKGQVLCLIEAMKLMNEIESDCDGEITTVYVENGRPVQFGDRLFAIRVK